MYCIVLYCGNSFLYKFHAQNRMQLYSAPACASSLLQNLMQHAQFFVYKFRQRVCQSTSLQT